MKKTLSPLPRLMCIAHAATVAVMALEAWMKTATPDEKFDMTEPPSESFDRQEVIVLMGEAQGSQKQKFLPISRSGIGKFFGFGDSNTPNLDKMEGLFAGMLPPNVATDEHRTLAKAMLKVKAVNVTKPGTTVRLTLPVGDSRCHVLVLSNFVAPVSICHTPSLKMASKMKKPMKKETDQSEFTEETALAFFARHLDRLKWKYHRFADRPSLFSGFNGGDVLWDFNMVARQKDDGNFLLAVTSFIPNKARHKCRAVVAELLTRINWELFLGCFEMNYADGEIRFRTSMILPGVDITDAIAEHLVRSNLCIVDERMPQIMAVLYSDVTPENALKPKAEKPAAATEPRFDFN